MHDPRVRLPGRRGEYPPEPGELRNYAGVPPDAGPPAVAGCRGLTCGWARIKEMTMRKLVRVAAVVATGGVLFQTAGCATSLAPLALSLLENILLSQLFGGLGGVL